MSAGAAPRAWVLNLDAEVEIEGRRPYPGPTSALAERPQLLGALSSLVPAGDAIVDGSQAAGSLAGALGFAWSPTPLALRELERVGARPASPIDAAVLRSVLGRRFSAELGLLLGGGCWVEAPDELESALAAAAASSGAILARRAFGFAGRGRRVLRQLPLSDADRDFVGRALREGGLLLEPLVEVSLDVSLHGHVSGGELVTGSPAINLVNAGGVWKGARRCEPGELSPAEDEALRAELGRAARALAGAGYAGPFGIDAFRYRSPHGEQFCPRCEINARYSMGWAAGMGERRPDLDVR